MARRVVMKVAVCLVIGAVVNVLVAWGCARWTRQQTWIDEKTVEAPSRWPKYLRELGWPTPTHADEMVMEQPGVSIIEISGGDPDADWRTTVPDSGKTGVSLELRQFGLPVRALQWEYPGVTSGPRSMAMLQAVEARIGRRAGIQIFHKNGELRCLPLTPLWSGFAMNTLFYAVIAWGACVLPFTIRRWMRRRKGLCAWCAYPVGMNEVCTECGRPVKKTLRASSLAKRS